MPSGRGLHRASTRALSFVMVVLGLVMVISTLARGGGAAAVGVVIGVLFIAAGAGRLYLATRQQ